MQKKQLRTIRKGRRHLHICAILNARIIHSGHEIVSLFGFENGRWGFGKEDGKYIFEELEVEAQLCPVMTLLENLKNVACTKGKMKHQQ